MSTKVTFILPAEKVADATEGILLGDFNGWEQKKGTPLKKQKDGSLKATLALEAGATYHYRYLLNDGRWENDENAEHYVYDYNVENCVITVPAAAEKVAKPKAPKKETAPKEAAPKKTTTKKPAASKKA